MRSREPDDLKVRFRLWPAWSTPQLDTTDILADPSFPLPWRNSNIWLEPIHPSLRNDAMDALNDGSVVGFLCKAGNEYSLKLVDMNREELLSRGLYEAALLEAFISTRTNNRHWQLSRLGDLFRLADRKRLRSAGNPLPGIGPFTLYRGVAGNGKARRVRGFSWTASIERANWFANRFPSLEDPAVFEVTIQYDDVLAYTDGRKEQEFIVLLPQSARPVRVSASESHVVQNE